MVNADVVRLPEETRALADATRSAPIRERLAAWRSTRPAERELLRKGITEGIASRKEASDGLDRGRGPPSVPQRNRRPFI